MRWKNVSFVFWLFPAKSICTGLICHLLGLRSSLKWILEVSIKSQKEYHHPGSYKFQILLIIFCVFICKSQLDQSRMNNNCLILIVFVNHWDNLIFIFFLYLHRFELPYQRRSNCKSNWIENMWNLFHNLTDHELSLWIFMSGINKIIFLLLFELRFVADEILNIFPIQIRNPWRWLMILRLIIDCCYRTDVFFETFW